MKRPYKILLASVWLAFASLIFFLPGSALPQNDMVLGFNLDKWAHVIIFLILLCLWSWAFQIRERKIYWILFAVSVIYGLLVEVIQQEYIPNRSFDTSDLLADFAGSMAGLGIWRLYNGYKKNKPL